MDVNILRIVATVISFVVFVGIIAWVWHRRRSKDYQDAAHLPLNEQ